MELERKVGLTANGKSVHLDHKNTRQSVLLCSTGNGRGSSVNTCVLPTGVSKIF